MGRQVLELAGDGQGRLRLLQNVAERLRGPLHEPAVREALGCLVPEWLDPRLDNKKPKGKTGGGEVQMGVPLVAGTWKVDVGREQVLADSSRLVGPDLLEFFSILARHVCEKLELPLYIGTSALGRRVGSGETLEHLCTRVEGWRQ